MIKKRICTQCHQSKDIHKDFYMCSGKWRSECKECTIKRNVNYQRRTKAWKSRLVDEDDRRAYMRQYYAKNKEKFAQYRIEFKERYPDYYKEYFQNRKTK